MARANDRMEKELSALERELEELESQILEQRSRLKNLVQAREDHCDPVAD